LEEIARVAEAQTVPVVLNASHALLGLDRLADLERLDNKIALFSTPDQVRWQSTAQKPAMRWVTMAMNGILARAAY
ncbi:type VI secretion system contractile sheath domain-containing protein, partial [Vibrio parahaemolyticus]|uniref:type VI secretion system contractile sheath domain-containing protein n=2 Tax=Pseudomonadati TaxID=3379134 RepID=UPI0021125856